MRHGQADGSMDLTQLRTFLAARADLERLRANDFGGVPLVTYAADLPIVRRYWRHVFDTRLEADPAW
ncbi:hypothetical protein [Nocardia sp. NPDC051981]|uniref:hypothetical protein n=1 Tax=Nocardia sp. NPDC051981 TaxID=3155417 RepID=UPI0034182BAE